MAGSWRNGICLVAVSGVTMLLLTAAVPTAADAAPVDDTWEELSTKSGTSTVLLAMNDHGDIVGTSENRRLGVTVPLLWPRDSTEYIEIPPPGPAGTYPFARAINNAGLVAVKYQIGIGYLWQDGKSTALTNPGYQGVDPHAINDLGQVAGESYESMATGDRFSFLWDQGRFTRLTEPAGWMAQTVDINNLSEITGTLNRGRPDEIRAVLWRGGELIDLGSFGGPETVPVAINERSQVIGSSELPSSPAGPRSAHPFLWQHGVLTDLIAGTGADTGTVNAINNAGQTVGSVGGRPVLWQDGIPTYLAAGSLTGEAFAINQRGQVAGLVSGGTLASGTHVFTWQHGELTILDPLPYPVATGEQITIIGIDERGRVAIQWDERALFRSRGGGGGD